MRNRWRNMLKLNKACGDSAGILLGVVAKPDNGNKHQQGTNDRVEKELQRCIDSILSAPDTDKKIHRDKNELPEHIKQECIHRHKRSRHGKLQEEQHRIIFLL